MRGRCRISTPSEPPARKALYTPVRGCVPIVLGRRVGVRGGSFCVAGVIFQRHGTLRLDRRRTHQPA
eukprot:12417770-Karenia_brevis.AAC.1